jgi:GNAT superfamily N-acetyltransferase
MRRYRDVGDYWRIRDFLREVFLANERREHSWQAYRFDYWRWHGVANLGHGRLEEDVFLWETGDGQIGAVLNQEGPGEAFLQVHPDWRAQALEEEMVAVAEAHLAVPVEGGRRRLRIWAQEGDALRLDILTQRGYVEGTWPGYDRWRPMSAPIPEGPVAEGYRVRALGGREELPARSWVSWRAFHPDEPDEAYQGWEWYPNVQRAPLYRRDLDIVAVAPDGKFASFCTVWFDDVTRCGSFEPVGTAPEHQRKGLGKAVMCEGLRRLEARGALKAFVGSFTTAAHALYASAGFVEYDLSRAWTKEM